jgi:glutaredoxin
MAHRVAFYTKPGCHLCEIAYQLLQGLQREFEFTLEEINIADDPVLLAEYGEKIPVVIIDHRTILLAPIHLVHVRAALTKRLD